MIKKLNKGFTLIELLVVIGILAILLSITLIAINPGRQFANANDTKRRSAVTQILNALGAYQAEHGGNLPDDISGLTEDDPTEIDFNLTSLCTDLVPDFIPALPQDPSQNDGADIEEDDCTQASPDWDTGYTVTLGANNRLTITAPKTENAAEDIAVSR